MRQCCERGPGSRMFKRSLAAGERVGHDADRQWEHVAYDPHQHDHEQSEDDAPRRSEEHTSELQSLTNLVCRLLLEKTKNIGVESQNSHPRRTHYLEQIVP